MYKCKYFSLEELLSESLFMKLKEQNKLQIGWLLLDERVLKTLDSLRENFGPIEVNDWKWGGKNNYRGFRPAGCHIGATYSQHKFGRACDCIFRNISVDEVRNRIIANSQDFPYIKGIEMGVSWLHFDVRNSEELILF